MKQKNLILMVVAVGCGLVAAFLTSQMNAKPAAVETQEVLVAAKDLPIGLMISKDDLKDDKLFKRKKFPKADISDKIVTTEEELAERRLTRAVRAAETINKDDLTKGGIITIPTGMNLVTLPMDLSRAAGGFAGPGSRVDLLTFVRLDNKVNSMPLLVNMLILAVDGQTTFPKEGVFASVSNVSFAADRKQSLVLEMSKARGCQLSLLLKNEKDEVDPNATYDIDKVIALLQDDKNPIFYEGATSDVRAKSKDKPKGTGTTTAPVPTPAVTTPDPVVTDMVKVPYALVDIKAGTELTLDLLDDPAVFGTRDLPKDVAADAVTDLKPLVGQVFRTGLGKGQWVTKSLVGLAEPKPSPRDPDTLPKAPKAESPKVENKPMEQRRTHDVTLHTTTGYEVYRYAEVEPGKWKMLGRVRPGSESPAAPDAAPAKPADPDKQVD